MLCRVALGACQRHAATFRAENHLKLEFCNCPGRIQGEKSFNPGFCNSPLKSLTTSLLCHIALEACLWLQYLTIFLSFWRTYLTVRIETFRHLYISKPRIANHYRFCCQARDARNIYNCDSWRQPPLPYKFAASHGSARRRETRQRRPSALANAV